VARAHGLAGEVVVELVTNRSERVAPGSRLVGERAGELLVERSRPFQRSGAGEGPGAVQSRWIVSLAGVSDRSSAEELHGEMLLAAPLSEPGALWVHELVGSEVLDTNGSRLGSVAAVVANPASDLLELDGGALLPARFVVEHSPGRVVVDAPPGLVD
jgi:16S rRNA processing protein RimM